MKFEYAKLRIPRVWLDRNLSRAREATKLNVAQVEWDRDGQYFYYLTKWMHTLHQIGQVSGETKYCDWASDPMETSRLSD